MLGFESAKRVIELGRSAFFPLDKPDLPRSRSTLISSDDLIPQFGYVGGNYVATRVLLLGINPGNGDGHRRSSADARMMPAHHLFAENPTAANSFKATQAYLAERQTWHVWKRHCSEVIDAGKLSMSEIAYSNCLPWRTDSESNFSEDVAKNAAKYYVEPLIKELNPSIVVAMGKGKVPFILSLAEVECPQVIVWNRSQAAKPSVRQERAEAAQEILRTSASLTGKTSAEN